MIYESEYAWAVISPDLIKKMQCQNMHLTDVDRNCVIDSIGYAKEKLNFKADDEPDRDSLRDVVAIAAENTAVKKLCFMLENAARFITQDEKRVLEWASRRLAFYEDSGLWQNFGRQLNWNRLVTYSPALAAIIMQVYTKATAIAAELARQELAEADLCRRCTDVDKDTHRSASGLRGCEPYCQKIVDLRIDFESMDVF